MTLVEQNEKLAKFMGGKYVHGIWIFNGSNGLPQNTNILLFDKSWDWIMLVVEKLDFIDGYTGITIDNDCVFLHRKHGEMLDFNNKECGSKIAAVYKAVCAGVEFLERLDKTAKAL